MTYDEAKQLSDFFRQYWWFVSPEHLMKRYGDLPFLEAQKKYAEFINDFVERSKQRESSKFYLKPGEF